MLIYLQYIKGQWYDNARKPIYWESRLGIANKMILRNFDNITYFINISLFLVY